MRNLQSVRGLALAAMALLAGCATAPEKSEPMIDPETNFEEYRTFGLHPYASAADSDTPMSLVDTYIRAAITTEMQRKGYEKAPVGSTGEIVIDYEAARAEKVKSSPFRIGIGIGSYGSGGGGSISTSTSGVKNISEGSLVIHAVDPERNTEVWRSRASRELGEGAIDSEVVQDIVSEVLSDFPVR